MPDRGPSRLRAALAAGLLGIVLATPAALAQTGEVPPPSTTAPGEGTSARWSGSSFSSPFDDDEPTLRSQPFTAAGVLRYEKPTPTDQIARAEVRVVDDPSDAWFPGEDCQLPLPMMVPGQGEHDDTGFVSVLRFEVSDLQVSCNGRFLLEAEGYPTDPGAPSHLMRQSFVVGVLPESVTDLAVALDAEARSVEVTFTPLAEEQRTSDAIGYVVERGGPMASDDPPEEFVDVARLGIDDEPRIVDDLRRAAGGTYTYRVRATRHGADRPERSSVITTETASVTIDAPPGRDGDATSTIDRTRSSRPRVTVAPRRSSTGAGGPRTITTLDTGFDGEIDYGDDGLPRTPGELPEFGDDDPLAGQSLIRDEGDGVDLAAPVAGALVLLGWAGHIAYLNRLAKQL